MFGQINMMYSCITVLRALSLREGSQKIWTEYTKLESHLQERMGTPVYTKVNAFFMFSGIAQYFKIWRKKKLSVKTRSEAERAASRVIRWQYTYTYMILFYFIIRLTRKKWFTSSNTISSYWPIIVTKRFLRPVVDWTPIVSNWGWLKAKKTSELCTDWVQYFPMNVDPIPNIPLTKIMLSIFLPLYQ